MSKKNNFKKGDSVLYSKKRYTIVNYSKNIEIDDGTGNITSLNSEEGLIKMMTEDELQFAYESIKEMLDFAQKTITMKKDSSLGSGVYGVSITILMACAFDTMGRIGLDKNNKESDGNRERFQFIQNNYIKNGNYGFSNNDFVDVFYKVYRCGLVHSGIIAKNFEMSSDNSVTNVIVQGTNGITTIYLDTLVKMTISIFNQLCSYYNLSYPTPMFLGESVTGDTQTIIITNT